MAIPRDPPDSGTPSDAYQSFGSDVSVKVTDLVSYFWEMQSLQGQVRLNAMQSLAPMQEMIMQGLATPMDNNILPEAAYAAQMLMDRLSDFTNFFNDVGNGIRDMGSAAAVIAEVYQNTDDDSAATINAVDFAFADPTATAPARFRPVTTWSDADMAAMQASGSMAMASTNAYDNMAKVDSTGGEWLRMSYPDGSSKEIVSYVQTPTMPGQSTIIVETTMVYGSDGTLLSTTTTNDYTTDNGAGKVRSQTVTEGDVHNGQSSTTTTSTAPDGTMTVSGSTTTTVDGKTSTQAREPVVITTDSHLPSPSDAGPVEKLEDAWQTHGDPSTVKQYGPGY